MKKLYVLKSPNSINVKPNILTRHRPIVRVDIDVHNMTPATKESITFLNVNILVFSMRFRLSETTHYKSLYKEKELYFEIEASQLKPFNKTKVLNYDGIEAAEMPDGLVKELLEAIDEIEDFGEAKHL